MNNQRAKFVAEMDRYRLAIKQTNSKYLKQDYLKKLKQMQSELMEYDRYHQVS